MVEEVDDMKEKFFDFLCFTKSKKKKKKKKLCSLHIVLIVTSPYG